MVAYLDDLRRYREAIKGSAASCARRLLVMKSMLFPRPDRLHALHPTAAARRADSRRIRVFALFDAVTEDPRFMVLFEISRELGVDGDALPVPSAGPLVEERSLYLRETSHMILALETLANRPALRLPIGRGIAQPRPIKRLLSLL